MSFKTHKLRDAIVIALAVGVAAPGLALAQNAEEKDSKTLDRIEVTGSRIKRAEVEGALPVTVIGRDQLETSGDISVADYLRNTSFNTFGSFQSTSGSSGQGFTGISLRGLGTNRTLILIDGRRAPTAPMIGNSQDLNSIPMAAVERIELLSDGASAIYGSDAIGGVVNVITRKDFEGIEASIGMGLPSEAGGDTREMSLVIGSSGERSRVLAGASHSFRDVIFTRDRDYWYNVPGASVYSNNFSQSTSTATSQRLNHPVFGTAVPGLCTNGDQSDLFYQAADRSCQFDHAATSANLTSLDNRAVFARGDVQINDNWMAYFTSSVNRTKSFGRYAPVPSSPWPGGAIRLVAGSPNHPSTQASAGGLNPNATDPYYAQFAGRDLFLFHRFAALGARDGNTENTTSSFMLGFEGLLWDKVDVDFGARYVQSRAISLGTNYVVGGLAQTAINAGRYNIYNPYSGNPGGLGITATISRDMETSVKEVFGTAGFDLFSLPGGNAAAVVGAEYREEAYQDIYDPLSSGGQIVGSAGNSAAGTRNVKAAYAEVLFPFFTGFEMSLAGRYDQYSDYGNDFAPKVSFRYHPIDSLTFRASYGKGFRAPSLDILSQKAAFSATATSDPSTCFMLTGSRSCNTQVSTYSIANPNLESENSKQWSAGVVWDATDWINTSLDYYNIKIENQIAQISLGTVVGCLRGTVSLCPSSLSTFPQGTVLPNEPLGLGAQFDPATGGIVNAQTGFGNIGYFETEGFDWNVRTNFDLGGMGRMRNHLSAGYVSNYAGNGGQNTAGRKGLPRIRANLNNTWSYTNWDFNWNISYIHGTQSQAYREWLALLNTPNHTASQASNFAFFGAAPKRLPSWVIHDVQASFKAPWNATVTVGVNNVANKIPVFESIYGGTSYDSTLYDPWGRVVYFRYTQRF